MQLLEEFREVDGLLVSNMGRVIGRRGFELKKYINHKGYVKVGNRLNSGAVHRLVARAFVVNPNPTAYNQVDHIDGCKTNNRHTNLRWVNNSINKKAQHDLRRKQGLPPCTPKELEVIRIGAEKSSKPVIYRGLRYPSQTSLAIQYGVYISTIARAVQRGYFRGYPIAYLSEVA